MSKTKGTTNSRNSKPDPSKPRVCGKCDQSSSYKRWIQCAYCLNWSHCNCVRIYDETIIKRYRCKSCCVNQDNEYGECDLKRVTNDYRLNQNESIRRELNKDRVQKGTPAFIARLKERKFVEPIEGREYFVLENNHHLEEHIKKDGFYVPIVVKKDKLMQVPEDFSEQVLVKHFGPEYPMKVFNSYKQATIEMTLREFTEIIEFSKIPYDSIDALELSGTNLMVEPPQAIRDRSWAEEAYKHPDLKAHRPAVEKYCWISMANAYSDFQIAFGGSMGWYHLVRGKQKFFFAKPTEENLAVYKRLEEIDEDDSWFLPDEIKDSIYVIDLEPGQTLLIPGGYMVATLTCEQSLLFVGNLLLSIQAEMQIRIFRMEEELKMQGRLGTIMMPNFELLHWLVIPKVFDELKQLNLTRENCKNNPLDSALYRSYRSFVQFSLDFYDKLKKKNEAPRSAGQHSSGTSSTDAKSSLDELETVLKHPNLLELKVMKRMLDEIEQPAPAPSLKRKSEVKQINCKQTKRKMLKGSPFELIQFPENRIDEPVSIASQPAKSPKQLPAKPPKQSPVTVCQPATVRQSQFASRPQTASEPTSSLEWSIDSIVAFLVNVAKSNDATQLGDRE